MLELKQDHLLCSERKIQIFVRVLDRHSLDGDDKVARQEQLQ